MTSLPCSQRLEILRSFSNVAYCLSAGTLCSILCGGPDILQHLFRSVARSRLPSSWSSNAEDGIGSGRQGFSAPLRER